MPYKQGDIVLVPFPFTDLSNTKTRPAIVVSNHHVNKSNDVILAQITTQPISGINAIKISNKDVTTNFKKPNNEMYISCKKIAVIEKTIIIKSITELNSEEIKERLLKKVQQNFDKEI